MAQTPLDWLKSNGAQGDVIDGLASVGDDWRTLWTKCPRGDWLLGIAMKLGVPHKQLVLAAIGAAHVGLDLALGPAPGRVVATAERWAQGTATLDEVREVTKALEEKIARSPDASTEAAARAALAVGLGVVEPEMLVGAPSAAVEANVLSSIDCGYEAAMGWAHDKCAAAVRAAIPWDEVERVLPQA